MNLIFLMAFENILLEIFASISHERAAIYLDILVDCSTSHWLLLERKTRLVSHHKIARQTLSANYLEISFTLIFVSFCDSRNSSLVFLYFCLLLALKHLKIFTWFAKYTICCHSIVVWKYKQNLFHKTGNVHAGTATLLKYKLQ